MRMARPSKLKKRSRAALEKANLARQAKQPRAYSPDSQSLVPQSLEVQDDNHNAVVVYFNSEDDFECNFLEEPNQSTNGTSNFEELDTSKEMSDTSDCDIIVSEEIIREPAKHFQEIGGEVQNDKLGENLVVFPRLGWWKSTFPVLALHM